jgi:hypothetical protein
MDRSSHSSATTRCDALLPRLAAASNILIRIVLERRVTCLCMRRVRILLLEGCLNIVVLQVSPSVFLHMKVRIVNLIEMLIEGCQNIMQTVCTGVLVAGWRHGWKGRWCDCGWGRRRRRQ